MANKGSESILDRLLTRNVSRIVFRLYVSISGGTFAFLLTYGLVEGSDRFRYFLGKNILTLLLPVSGVTLLVPLYGLIAYGSDSPLRIWERMVIIFSIVFGILVLVPVWLVGLRSGNW